MGKHNNNLDITPEEQFQIMLDVAMGNFKTGSSEEEQESVKENVTKPVTESRPVEEEVITYAEPVRSEPSLFEYSKGGKKNKKKNGSPKKKYRELNKIFYMPDESSDDEYDEPTDIASTILRSAMPDEEDRHIDKSADKFAEMIANAVGSSFIPKEDTETAPKMTPIIEVNEESHVLYIHPNLLVEDDGENMIKYFYNDSDLVRYIATAVYYIAAEFVTVDDYNFTGILAKNILKAINDSRDQFFGGHSDDTDDDEEPEETIETKIYEEPTETVAKTEREMELEKSNIKVFGEAIKIPDDVRNAIKNADPVEVDPILPEKGEK